MLDSYQIYEDLAGSFGEQNAKVLLDRNQSF